MLFSMDRLFPHSFPGQAKKNNKGRILCIEGSPGVGKPHLVRTMASAGGVPFQGIAVGGAKDSSFFEGHGITYEGAVPGCMVKALRKVKVMNPYILLDEVDKLSDHDQANDVTGVLLHMLDESQNNEFSDKYLGDVPLDVSNIFWVITINDRT